MKNGEPSSSGASAAAGVAGRAGPASERAFSESILPGQQRLFRRCVLLGNPNTGKTTLFNRLTGLRHKTSNFPGTTVEARVGRMWLGDCLEEVDAAVGLPESGQRRSNMGALGTPPCGPQCACAEAAAKEEADGEAEGWDGDPLTSEVVDLPGVYSLELRQLEAEVCRAVLDGEAAPRGAALGAPDAICIVADATNLARTLVIAGEAARRRLPTVVAVNMIDLSRKRGVRFDPGRLAEAVGCEVVCISARQGEGVGELRRALARARIPLPMHPVPGSGGGSPGIAPDPSERSDVDDDAALREWTRGAIRHATMGLQQGARADRLTDRLDAAFTHPVLGLLIFAAAMAGLFWMLFSLATIPMDLIEKSFGLLSSGVTAVLGEGPLGDLLAHGVVEGVGATVIFLPQIALLFFLITLLEDTGYLARAAFVMNKMMRPFGLSGHAFVPLLSSHACALPGIMATRTIPDRRERLAAILVAPFMTCSARLPVYVLLISVLFAGQPGAGWKSALAFVGCYALGAVAGVVSALLARRTILRGRAMSMALELPSYKLPSLRTALIGTWDRSVVFLRKAGTVILAISMTLWWLSNYPKSEAPPASVDLRQQAEVLTKGPRGAIELRAEAERIAQQPDDAMAPSGRDEEGRSMPMVRQGARMRNNTVAWYLGEAEKLEAQAEEKQAEADRMAAKAGLKHSFAGRIGRTVQPIFEPLGWDWQLSIGVMTSFAAREVFVNTMAVVVTGSEEAGDGGDEGLREQIAGAARDDGKTPLFDRGTSWSLLVYFVLAMQCLPTLAVTARESGGGRAGLKWAMLQLAWMLGVAYVAAFVAAKLAGGG